MGALAPSGTATGQPLVEETAMLMSENDLASQVRTTGALV